MKPTVQLQELPFSFQFQQQPEYPSRTTQNNKHYTQIQKLAASYVLYGYGKQNWENYLCDHGQIKVKITNQQYNKLFTKMMVKTIKILQWILIHQFKTKITPITHLQLIGQLDLIATFERGLSGYYLTSLKKIINFLFFNQKCSIPRSHAFQIHKNIKLCFKLIQQKKQHFQQKTSSNNADNPSNSEANKPKQFVFDAYLKLQKGQILWTQQGEKQLLNIYRQNPDFVDISGFILKHNPHLGEILRIPPIRTKVKQLLLKSYNRIKQYLKRSADYTAYKSVIFRPHITLCFAHRTSFYNAHKILVDIYNQPILTDPIAKHYAQQLAQEILKTSLHHQPQPKNKRIKTIHYLNQYKAKKEEEINHLHSNSYQYDPQKHSSRIQRMKNIQSL